MTQAQTVDQLIFASWVLPMTSDHGPGTTLNDHAIAITDQKIVDILPWHEAEQRYQATATFELPGQAIMPGLINAHGHAAMTLFRGMADDQPLMTWLQDHIWPAEGQWVSPEFVKDGTELAIAEMLLTGTTCFHDMYFFPDQAAHAAHHAGIRALITFPIFDFPSAWGQGPDDYIAKGLKLRDDFKHSQYVSIGFGPHAPYTVSDTALQRVATLAAELDAPVQMHVHETASEVETALQESRKRPLQRLHALNLITPRFQAVHMTQVSEEDIELLKLTGGHVIHCPNSNLKLASGFCPVQRLLDAGINVALGTDGAASNNALNLFAELNTAALVAKAVSNDATAVNAHQALAMATINGAKAMGQDEFFGCLKPGKYADIIAIDLSQLASQPVYQPESQLVYTGAGNQVSHVWVAGQLKVKQGKLTQINTSDLIERAQAWKNRISEQR